MSYPHYLRERASDCIRLAVEEAWEPSSAELIDLARDYRQWAELSASNPDAVATGWSDAPAADQARPRGWRALFATTRH